MAERIAKKLANKRGIKEIKFSSAGLCAKKENISDNAKFALKQLGYDARNKKSVGLKKINPNLIYVAMTDEIRARVNSEKVLSFAQIGKTVPDPYGKNKEVYLATAKLLEENINMLLTKIENLRGAL